MKILFDHNTPRRLRRYLQEHSVDTARDKGWAEVSNGILLAQAERDGYDLLITADQSMRYQQNLDLTQVGVIVLLSNRWPEVRMRIGEILAAIEEIQPGELREVPIPSRDEV